MPSRSRTTAARLLAIAVVGLALLATMTTPVQAAPTEVELPVADHGEIPLTATTVAGAATGMMPDGSPRTWAVVSGKPAYLAEIDPLAGQVLASHPLEGASGAWGVEIAEDGTVWVSSYGNGELFHLAPGADEVVNAGQPHPDASFLWQVDTDADGIAYTGSFLGFAEGDQLPPARLGAYDRTTGEWRDYGEFGDDYTYIRSTAVVGDTVYVGTGTVGAMFAVDIESGDKTEIPMPEDRTDCQFTYEMAVSGTDLWVKFQCTDGNAGYVWDTEAQEWVQGPFPHFGDQRVGRDEAGNTWFTGEGNVLYSSSPEREVTETDVVLGPKGIGVVSDGDAEYVIGMTNNVIDRYDIATGEVEQVVLELTGTPTTPRSAVMGPDDRLHFGGYFSGGFASYDPSSQEWAFEAGLGQTEGFATVGDTLYAGRYPGARIDAIDPTKPFGDGNPRRVADLDGVGQDRPFALVDAAGLLVVGTVPEYGSLTGALAVYDPATGETDTRVNLIEDHSITALAYEKGVVYGGTSVYGGNGAAPTQQNARVFAFDLASRTILWDVEIPGQRQVTSVEVTPGRQVWAATRGSLYALSTTDGQQQVSYEIVPFDWGEFAGGTWHGDDLAYDRDANRLYGSVGGKLIRLRPLGRHDVEVLAGASGGHLVLGTDHRVYWVDGQHLRSVDWREG